MRGETLWKEFLYIINTSLTKDYSCAYCSHRWTRVWNCVGSLKSLIFVRDNFRPWIFLPFVPYIMSVEIGFWRFFSFGIINLRAKRGGSLFERRFMGRVAHIGPLRSWFFWHNWSKILVDLDGDGSKCVFFKRAQHGVVYFLMAPSIGVVCLVAETQKQVLSELGST